MKTEKEPIDDLFNMEYKERYFIETDKWNKLLMILKNHKKETEDLKNRLKVLEND